MLFGTLSGMIFEMLFGNYLEQLNLVESVDLGDVTGDADAIVYLLYKLFQVAFWSAHIDSGHTCCHHRNGPGSINTHMALQGWSVARKPSEDTRRGLAPFKG